VKKLEHAWSTSGWNPSGAWTCASPTAHGIKLSFDNQRVICLVLSAKTIAKLMQLLAGSGMNCQFRQFGRRRKAFHTTGQELSVT